MPTMPDPATSDLAELIAQLRLLLARLGQLPLPSPPPSCCAACAGVGLAVGQCAECAGSGAIT